MGATALLTAALRRKRLDPSNLQLPGTTERPLNLFDLILLGIGGTLGSGLFLLTGRAARYVAGPALTVSFLIAGIACFFSALSYAEMSSRLPNSGGAYSFTYAALGELPAFLVGMCLTLEYGVSAAAVARSWASYLGDALPFLPSWFIASGTRISFLAFTLVFVASVLLSFGMRDAKWVINSATLIYGLVVLIIIVFGARKVQTDNWDPFLPFGWQGVVAGSSAVFFAYIGFDEVAAVAEEANDSSRTVPLAILISMLVVSALYIVASLVLTGLVSYDELDASAPFSAAFRTAGLPIIARLVGFGTALGMMNTTTVALAAQPRIFMSMGRDGLLPRSFALSTRSTTLSCGTVVALLAIVVETQSLADVVSGGTLLAFLATNMSLLLTRCRIHERSRATPMLIYAFMGGSALTGLVGRLTASKLIPRWLGWLCAVPACLIPGTMLLTRQFDGGASYERSAPSFLCPWVPLMPMFGAFTTCFLLFQLSNKALSALCTWLAVSAAVYFSYGARNAIIAGDYLNMNEGSPHGSYNSFDNLAIEAHSISSETPSEEKEKEATVPSPRIPKAEQEIQKVPLPPG